MRAAYVCADSGVPVFGKKGCSIHVQEVVRAMQDQGVLVDLFVNRVGGDPPSDLVPVQIHRLPNARTKRPVDREKAALHANQDLQRALNDNGPYDLVYERYSLWSFGGMQHAAEASIPGLLEVNAPLVNEQAVHRGLVDRAAAEQVVDQAFGASAALIAVSEEVADYVRGRCPAVRQRVHVVSNVVNAARFCDDEMHKHAESRDTFTIGFVGSLKPWHGLEVLIESFDLLLRQDSRFRLLFVGDGPCREHLERDLASRSSALREATHFTGAVDAQEIPDLLSGVQVAVAPYPDLPDFYFSPLKVYEYMAAGLPIVASAIGEVARLLQHEATGLLCPPGDAQSLAAAVLRLRRDRALRERLGAAARQQVLESHTWDAVARRILRIANLQTPLEVVSRTGTF